MANSLINIKKGAIVIVPIIIVVVLLQSKGCSNIFQSDSEDPFSNHEWTSTYSKKGDYLHKIQDSLQEISHTLKKKTEDSFKKHCLFTWKELIAFQRNFAANTIAEVCMHRHLIQTNTIPKSNNATSYNFFYLPDSVEVAKDDNYNLQNECEFVLEFLSVDHSFIMEFNAQYDSMYYNLVAQLRDSCKLRKYTGEKYTMDSASTNYYITDGIVLIFDGYDVESQKYSIYFTDTNEIKRDNMRYRQFHSH